MNRALAPLFLILAAWVPLSTSEPAQADARVVAIFDDSGAAATLNADDTKLIKQTVLWQLGKIGKGVWKAATLTLISVHDPRVLWQGRLRDIKRNGAELAELTTAQSNACADQIGAFALAASLLQQKMTDSALVIAVSPLVHAQPCDDPITLPQDVPDGVPLAAFARRGVAVRLLAAHHLQKLRWSQALQAAGISNSQVLGIEESKALLRERRLRDVF